MTRNDFWTAIYLRHSEGKKCDGIKWNEPFVNFVWIFWNIEVTVVFKYMLLGAYTYIL